MYPLTSPRELSPPTARKPCDLWSEPSVVTASCINPSSMLSRSVVSDSAAAWTVACQASQSVGFPRTLEQVAISAV